MYGSKIGDFFVGKPAPDAAVEAAKNSLGGAIAVSRDLANQPIAGAKQLSATLVDAANHAFVEAFRWGSRVGAIVLGLGVVIVLRWLPARASAADIADQLGDQQTAGAVR